MIYSDEYIDHWTDIFRDNHLASRMPGLTLLQFLAQPEQLLQEIIFGIRPPKDNGFDYYPLLETQREIYIQLIVSDRDQSVYESLESVLLAGTNCRVSGNRYIEPLRHHSYEVSHVRDRKHAQRRP